MTAKTRRNLLRMADAATNAQERSAKQLMSLHQVYDPEYPDLALEVAQIAKLVLDVRDIIIRFRKERM